MGVIEDIAAFEQALNELVVKYEQYFLGMEKREPLRLLQQVDRFARQYQPVQITNTMHRFRYTSLVARLSSYRQHWQRTVRQIEEGTYSRDRFKMALHEKGAGKPPAPHEPAPAASTGTDVDRLYHEYLAARQSCHLPTTGVSRDLIQQAMEKQLPLLKQKYNCPDIEFHVTVEEGTPKIKARPKKSGTGR
jgi:hypothetical protein